MSYRQRNILVHVNRALIFVLTLIGMSMDGFEAADAVLTAALVVWLWLPQCMRIEAAIFERVESRRGS